MQLFKLKERLLPKANCADSKPEPSNETSKMTRLLRWVNVSFTKAKKTAPEGEAQLGQATLLKALLHHGTYSDLTITCGNKTFQVHKAVVCPQSSFFATACEPHYKEGQEGKIDLPDDDPEIVTMLIEYLYNGTYTIRPPERQKPHWVQGATLILHSKLYGLAEKYLVHSLKTLAVRRFTHIAKQSGWLFTDMAAAAQHAFTSTPDGDRKIRDVIIEQMYNHRRKGEEAFEELFAESHEICYDYIAYVKGVEKARKETKKMEKKEKNRKKKEKRQGGLFVLGEMTGVPGDFAVL